MLFTSDSSQLGAKRGCTSWYNPQEVLQVVRYVKAGRRWSWGKNSLNIKFREEMSEDEIEVGQGQLMLKNWGPAAISAPSEGKAVLSWSPEGHEGGVGLSSINRPRSRLHDIILVEYYILIGVCFRKKKSLVRKAPLIIAYFQKKRPPSSSSGSGFKSAKRNMRNKYFLFHCVLFFSALGVLATTPLVPLKIYLMTPQ